MFVPFYTNPFLLNKLTNLSWRKGKDFLNRLMEDFAFQMRYPSVDVCAIIKHVVCFVLLQEVESRSTL